MAAASSWIGLHAGGRRATVSASRVRRVVPARAIVPIPLTPGFVAGVLIWEGKAVPVYRLADLPLHGAAATGGSPGSGGEGEEIVIVEIDGALAGFLVEATAALHQERDAGACDAPALMAAAGVVTGTAGGSQAAQAAQGDL